MNTKTSRYSSTLLLILLAAFLFIFAKNWEPGLGVSSTTYGALAKNILRSSNWFHFSLGPNLYEPFVEHPYLKLWLDALVFKFLGISAQTIRLVSSIGGLCCIAALFGAAKKSLGENVAAWSCLCLFTVTIFFNFMASGWFDIPMIAFIIGGFYFITIALSSSCAVGFLFLAGASLAGALLTKGVAALGVIPLGFYVIYYFWRKPLALLAFAAGVLLPLGAFTIAHYQFEGFIFWKQYWARQTAQNHVQNQVSTLSDFFWYILGLFEMGHVLLLLLPLGIWKIFKRNKPLAALISAEMLIHLLAYSFSSRHYRQYTLPVYPWMALAAGAFLSELFATVTAQKIARSLAVLGLIFFIVVDLIPVRVHAGNDVSYRALMVPLAKLKDDGRVFFPGKMENQDFWEIFGSYISWYFDRTPNLAEPQRFLEILNEHPQSLGMINTRDQEKFGVDHGKNSHGFEVCAWNDELSILATPDVCPREMRNFHPLEGKQPTFSR